MIHSPTSSFSAPEWLDFLNQKLSAYEFLGCIAHGGVGAVFKARQRSLDREVAIKILLREPGGNEAFRNSFDRAAKAMARLNHPNLIGVFGSGEVDGMLYIVMEYVPGNSLQLATGGQPVDPREAVRIVHAICMGLAHAHENGVIHGDLKPTNVFLNLKAEPKISDFGLYAVGDSGKGGRVIGNPGYAAPEFLANPEMADCRIDLFSVGAIFHEMLCGKLPGGMPGALKDLDGCEAGLRSICQRALQPHPHFRYPDAPAMVADLEAWQRQSAAGVGAVRRSGIPAKPPRTTQMLAKTPMPPRTAGIGSVAQRPDKSFRPAMARQGSSRPGGGGQWYLLIRILLMAAIVGSFPFSYRAITRYREDQERKKTESQELQERTDRESKQQAKRFHGPFPTLSVAP